MGGISSSLRRFWLADQPSDDVPASCGGEHGGASVREAHSSVAGMSELEISVAIKKSEKQGWSEVREGASPSGGLDDSVIWKELKATYPHFFIDDVDVKLGRKIAEGGQAHIYEAILDVIPDEVYVAKVFKTDGFCLADLKRQWPLATKTPKQPDMHRFVLGGVVFGESMLFCSLSLWGTFLEDGQFAIVMKRYWGDLRTLIDLKCRDNNFQRPPFSLMQARSFMREIAIGMKCLHERGVLHRDLKAANVLLWPTDLGEPVPKGDMYTSRVGDYESSMMIQGTGFWRAPEILEDLMKKVGERDLKIWTDKADVYSYAMICYEILTGHLPFDGYSKRDWHKIIYGERPLWPDYVDSTLREIVERCWDKEPSKRPTFEVIQVEIENLRGEHGLHPS